jgi:hypothetical protein
MIKISNITDSGLRCAVYMVSEQTGKSERINTATLVPTTPGYIGGELRLQYDIPNACGLDFEERLDEVFLFDSYTVNEQLDAIAMNIWDDIVKKYNFLHKYSVDEYVNILFSIGEARLPMKVRIVAQTLNDRIGATYTLSLSDVNSELLVYDIPENQLTKL